MSGRGPPPPPPRLAPSFDYHFGIAEGKRAPRQSRRERKKEREEFLRSITDQLRRTDKFVIQRKRTK